MHHFLLHNCSRRQVKLSERDALEERVGENEDEGEKFIPKAVDEHLAVLAGEIGLVAISHDENDDDLQMPT